MEIERIITKLLEIIKQAGLIFSMQERIRRQEDLLKRAEVIIESMANDIDESVDGESVLDAFTTIPAHHYIRQYKEFKEERWPGQ